MQRKISPLAPPPLNPQTHHLKVVHDFSYELTIIMKLFLSVVFGVVLAVSGVVCQNSQSPSLTEVAEPAFNMLVLGDSVLWGEGLRTEHKSWNQVKLWIEKSMGRPVIEKIEAHAGPVVDGGSAAHEKLKAIDGEVDVALPSVLNQVDRALKYYGDRAKVNLVLVNGCVNDIGARKLLAASSSNEIIELTEAKCGPPIERLLRKITTSFPNANVIVTGSRRPTLNSKNRAEHKRVRFARLQFAPEYAYGTKRTRLWGFDRSPFRIMLALLSFGKILLPTNDEVRSRQNASCKEVFPRQRNESSEQDKERRRRLLLCRYAALGHPSRAGSQVYTEAITDLLKTIPSGFSSAH